MNPVFTFPDFRQIYTQTSYFSWENIKFQIRKWRAYQAIFRFEKMVNQNPQWIELLNQTPRMAYPLLHTYLDQQFNTPAKKLNIFIHDMYTMQNLAGGQFFQHFLAQKACILAKVNEDLYYQININQLDINEGLWSLSLCSHQHGTLYAASFGFLPNGQFLISSLQGPRENGKERVKQLTKELHGLRPQHLTIAMLQLFATYAQHPNILGITQDRQVKLRWRLKKRVSMNYDVFWQECGGVLNPEGYWQLDTSHRRKPETEIASKKRAMYRRRYEMLDSLENDVKNLFNHDVCIA